MTANIAQSFLRDAIGGEGHIFGQIWRDLVSIDVHSHRVGPCNAFTLGLQRFDKTEIIEHGRVQSVRKIMDIFAQLRETRANGSARLTRWRQIATRKLRGVDRQSSEPLCDVVVQFAREPAPFVFMRADQPSAQGLCFLLGAPAADALPYEPNRQRSLQQKYRHCRDDQNAMLVPKRWRPKANRAPRR